MGEIPTPAGLQSSTQVAFGKIMTAIGNRKDALADRVVTASPDVASSTNLSAWINKRGVYHVQNKEDTFRQEKVPSTLKWIQTPQGQHIELGIAENNLFTLLSSLGLSEQHFGARLLPIGTLYDPFICRGLDALNYGCYQDSRFIVVGTPSGVTLAPEGGAHQSFNTQLIGMAQDNLLSFEPAYSDELACIMQWSLDYMQRESGSSVYLRLSTRSLKQPQRAMTSQLQEDILEGGYWLKEPKQGSQLAILYMGVIGPEAEAAYEELADELPDAGLLAITSADRLFSGWQAAKKARQLGEGNAASHIEKLLAPLATNAGLVTIVDGYPATLSWVGGVLGHRVESLGVEKFGQSGDIPDIYDYYRINTKAILDACAAVCMHPFHS